MNAKESGSEEAHMSRPAIFRSTKSLAGLALVVLGTLILQANFAAALACTHQMLSAARTMNLVAAITLTALQSARFADGADQHLVRILLQHTLMMFWPVLLVVAGSFLFRLAVTGHVSSFSKKDF